MFPASDPVARFVTVVAMMSNDWLRLMGIMIAAESEAHDDAGIRLLSFRQQAALYHEAAKFLTESRRRFPDVDRFVNDLDAATRLAFDRVVGGLDATSPHFQGQWLVDQRNVTFHYPKMHPNAAAHGDEELMKAMDASAGQQGTITEGKRAGEIRFGFADEVVVQWLPPVENSRETLGKLVEAVTALGEFARKAIESYLTPYSETGVLRRDDG